MCTTVAAAKTASGLQRRWKNYVPERLLSSFSCIKRRIRTDSRRIQRDMQTRHERHSRDGPAQQARIEPSVLGS